jgi:hypothetical protein
MEVVYWPGVPDHHCAQDLEDFEKYQGAIPGCVVRCDCGTLWRYVIQRVGQRSQWYSEWVVVEKFPES